MKNLEMIHRAIKLSPKRKLYQALPDRVTDALLTDLVKDGIAFTGSNDPYTASEQIRNAGDKLVLLPLEHRIRVEENNTIVKDVRAGNFLYLDSRPVVQLAIRRALDFAVKYMPANQIPKAEDYTNISGVTDSMLRELHMVPKFMIAAAFDYAISRRDQGQTVEPPIGFYWVGPDGKARVVTWKRSIGGFERFKEAVKGKVKLEMDKKTYADTMSYSAPSETKKGRDYPFSISHVPIGSANDETVYSEWRRLETTDTTADARYRGVQDQKRALKRYFWTQNAIAGYALLGRRLKKTHELGKGVEVRINPFPMAREQLDKLCEITDEQVLIGRNPANMTETDRIIGADTIKRGGYYTNFLNWTFKNEAKK